MVKVADFPTMRFYQHHKGGKYMLLLITNQGTAKEGWAEQCVYVSMEDKKTYTRPLFEFAEKFTLLDEEPVKALPLHVAEGFNLQLRSPYATKDELLASILLPVVLLDVFGASMEVTTK
jgi:hypothetical protein